MNDWWFLSILVILAFLTAVAMIYPLRQYRVVSGLLSVMVFFSAIFSYYLWGGFPLWQEYVHQNQAKAQALNVLKTIKNPNELIDKLRAKLDENPESAKGWYLLGRLYIHQNDPKNALKAFEKAYRQKPEEEQFAVHYAHQLWLMHDKKFNEDVLAVVRGVLKNNPKQPDALSMLAMNAFFSHDYEGAIHYWQQLLKLAPNQSEEAMAIRKAIAKAQEQMTQGRKENDR